MTSLVHLLCCFASIILVWKADGTQTSARQFALTLPPRKDLPINSTDKVYINGEPGTTFSISSSSYNSSYIQKLDSKGIATVDFTIHKMGTTIPNTTDNAAILLDADNDVTVHVVSEQNGILGGYLAYPVIDDATYFIVPPGGDNCSISIAAYFNETTVELLYYDRDRKVNITECTHLHSALVYRSNVCTEGEVSFIEVRSSYPISVFSGKSCSPACGENWEQIPPITMWGQRFILTLVNRRDQMAVFRGVAAFDNTSVRHGSNHFSIHKGEYIDIYVHDITGHLLVEASSPILLYQSSYTYPGGNLHEHFMVVPPIQQYTTAFQFWLPETEDQLNRIEVVVEETGLLSLLYDDFGQLTTYVRNWISIPDTGYVVGSMSVVGAHKIRMNDSEAAFMVMQYSGTESGIYGVAAGSANKLLSDIHVMKTSECFDSSEVITSGTVIPETTTETNRPIIVVSGVTIVTTEVNSGPSVNMFTTNMFTTGGPGNGSEYNFGVITAVMIVCFIILVVFAVDKMRSKHQADDKPVLFPMDKKHTICSTVESYLQDTETNNSSKIFVEPANFSLPNN